MAEPTLYWHDYETWGTNPRADRAVQFAGVRTDLQLNSIDKPLIIYCKPTTDFVPSPYSALITGMTPQKANEKGLIEAEFFSLIFEQLARPATCSVGYNSLRFDDEVTRFGFYRNFYDAYVREWQNGNSRWDIVDLVRMAYALRPEGINWPRNEYDESLPSFRLDQLSLANGIDHEKAHDALSDVYATIGLVRLIRQLQPRLYDYYFKFRQKRRVLEEIDLVNQSMFLHVSGMYPSSLGCIAPVMPLAQHPVNNNGVIVYDLRCDPQMLLELSSTRLQELLFTPTHNLAENEQRPALKTIHINKSPAIAPLSTLTDQLAEKWQIDLNQAEKYRALLLGNAVIGTKITQIFSGQRLSDEPLDPDIALYQGFIKNSDAKLQNQVRTKTPEELVHFMPEFKDQRLQRLYFRYRARNWPETLTPDERQKWQHHCSEQVKEGKPPSELTISQFHEEVAQIQAEKELTEYQQQILKDLEYWVDKTLDV